MTNRTKGWLIAAASLILAGCILFVGVMSVLKWDFKKLTTVEYETNTHTVTESFAAVSITADAADITFVPSEDGTVSVVCYEESARKHCVEVTDDTLVIRTDVRHWYDHIGVGFQSPTVTISLPEGAYGALSVSAKAGNVSIPICFTFASMDIDITTGDVSSMATVEGDVKIHTTTGDIALKSLNAGSLDLSVSTGDVSVKNVFAGNLCLSMTTGQAAFSRVHCQAFTTNGTTGDLFMRDVVADGAFTIERTTGDVTFEACDAASMTVKTGTGDILGTLLTQKQFVTQTTTGNVKLPALPPSGGVCELTTTTGNIHISIQ